MKTSKRQKFNPDNRSKLYEKAVSIISDLVKKESVNMALDAFAEATTDEWKAEFKKQENVDECQKDGCITQLLTGKKCTPKDHLNVNNNCFPPFNDHYALWKQDKKPVCYTSEVYDLSYEKLKKIIEYCEKNNLKADLNYSSPYYPGRTFCIKYTINSE